MDKLCNLSFAYIILTLVKVEAITGRNDEAIMNFEKVNKDASGVNVRESLFL